MFYQPDEWILPKKNGRPSLLPWKELFLSNKKLSCYPLSPTSSSPSQSVWSAGNIESHIIMDNSGNSLNTLTWCKTFWVVILNKSLQNMWFQQDESSFHTARSMYNLFFANNVSSSADAYSFGILAIIQDIITWFTAAVNSVVVFENHGLTVIYIF